MWRVGHTIYIRCIFCILGREITKYMVICGVYIYGSSQPYSCTLQRNFWCALLRKGPQTNWLLWSAEEGTKNKLIAVICWGRDHKQFDCCDLLRKGPQTNWLLWSAEEGNTNKLIADSMQQKSSTRCAPQLLRSSASSTQSGSSGPQPRSLLRWCCKNAGLPRWRDRASG